MCTAAAAGAQENQKWTHSFGTTFFLVLFSFRLPRFAQIKSRKFKNQDREMLMIRFQVEDEAKDKHKTLICV